MKNKEFAAEKEFISTMQDIKRKKTEDEPNVYSEIVNIVNNTSGPEERKKLIIKLIDNLGKDIQNLNPLASVAEINNLFTKLILIAKSKDLSVPSELLIPMLNMRDDLNGWLTNMREGIIPYAINGNLFNIIKIKD